jgi:hypothetical protein
MLQVLLVPPGILFGLYWPDVDQYLRGLLHHRSILTHSALVLLVLTGPGSRGGWRGELACGAAIGLALHMAADMLSPMRGYALIYLPWPLEMSLGRWSLWWLGGNVLLCLLVARHFWRMTGFLLAATVTVSGLLYAVFNEKSLLATSLVIVLGGCALVLTGRTGRAAMLPDAATPVNRRPRRR